MPPFFFNFQLHNNNNNNNKHQKPDSKSVPSIQFQELNLYHVVGVKNPSGELFEIKIFKMCVKVWMYVQTYFSLF